MKITLIQQDIAWANPAVNQKAAEQAMLSAAKSDLYVLPEMWSTGFATEPEGIAESHGASLRWMVEMAQRLDAAVAGSIATEVDGRYYNRFYFVKPGDKDHEVAYYDKHHLFTYGGEHLRYTRGEERVVVEWRGARFLLQVCYDLRFPIFARNKMNERPDYDCILYVASWPTPRVEAWRTLLLARAIENQCYVCGVNRVGQDPTCQYCGGTAFIDPYGVRQEEVPMNEAGLLTVHLDMESLNAFREKFPVLRDRDL